MFFRMTLTKQRVIEKRATMCSCHRRRVCCAELYYKSVFRDTCITKDLGLSKGAVRCANMESKRIRAKLKYARDFRAATCIQKIARGRQGRRRARRVKRQLRKRRSTQIQTVWRGYIARARYRDELRRVSFGASKIQARFRGQRWRRKMLLRDGAANLLQRHLRGLIARRRAKRRRYLFKNAGVIQSIARGRLSTARLKQMRIERIAAEEARLSREAVKMRERSRDVLKSTLRSFKTRDGKQIVRTETSRVKAEVKKQQVIVRTMSKEERCPSREGLVCDV